MTRKQDAVTRRRRPGPFTLVDQVNALVEAREADAELGFMERCCMDHPEGCLYHRVFQHWDNLDAT